MSDTKELTIRKSILLLVIIVSAQLVVGIIIGGIYSTVYARLHPAIDAAELYHKLTSDQESSIIINILIFSISELVLLFVILGVRNKYTSSLKNDFSTNDLNILLILGIILFSIFFNAPASELENIIASLTGRMLSTTNSLMNISQIPGIPGFLIAIVLVCVIPSVIEEALFRGIIQKNLSRKYGNTKAIIFTSIFFALLHISPSVIIPIFLSSLMLGYVYSKTNNLFYSIILHFFDNLITVILLRTTSLKIPGWNTSPGDIEHMDLRLVIPSLIFAVIAGWFILKINIKENDAELTATTKE